jgi:multidrug efflux pump subunit AcrB
VRTRSGELVSIDNLVTVEESTTPPSLYHFNRYKSATISAGLAPGKTIGDGIKAMEEIKAQLLDDTFTTSLIRHIKRLCGKRKQYLRLHLF